MPDKHSQSGKTLVCWWWRTFACALQPEDVKVHHIEFFCLRCLFEVCKPDDSRAVFTNAGEIIDEEWHNAFM
jgi:hypothetical protein